MNRPVDNQINGELMPGLLEARWDSVASVAVQLADELDIKSEGLGGNFRKQTLAASHFFRGGCDYHRALKQPAVLAIANPLARLGEQSQNNEISPSEISTAVHLGLCTLSRHGSNHRNLLRIFLDPILLTYFFAFGALFVSHFVLEPFSVMYAEFGIMLPTLTQWLLNIGYFIRIYTVTILLVMFGGPPLLWLVNWIGHENREPGMSRLDLILSTKRPTVARWLLHVSLLLEAGLSRSDAIQLASSISGKIWIKRRAATYKRKHNHESEDAGDRVRFFGKPKFSMADTAILTTRSRGQITLLQHVATWYRDTSSNIIEWIVQLLIPVYVFLILASVFVLVVSLLMPLFAIVSGLTGVPGGFM